MVERVYCVATAAFPEPSEAVLPLSPPLYQLLLEAGEFLSRSKVEADERWRQIIPYAVVTSGRRVLLVERLQGGSEARLHNRLSIGLGGHVNPIKHANARDLLEGGLARELQEELVIGAYVAEAVGLIHSRDDPVSRVHTGLLYRVRTPGEVDVRETDKLSGMLTDWEAVGHQREQLESWSRMAYDFLNGRI